MNPINSPISFHHPNYTALQPFSSRLINKHPTRKTKKKKKKKKKKKMAGKSGHFFVLTMVILSLALVSVLSAEAIRPSAPEPDPTPEMEYYEDGGCAGRGGEEGCLMRRFMAVAHTDYIYTQDVNVHDP